MCIVHVSEADLNYSVDVGRGEGGRRGRGEEGGGGRRGEGGGGGRGEEGGGGRRGEGGGGGVRIWEGGAEFHNSLTGHLTRPGIIKILGMPFTVIVLVAKQQDNLDKQLL